MHKVFTIAALGILFTGSVLADDIGMEQQKQQMEQNERAARGTIDGSLTGTATMPDIAPHKRNVTVEDGRDLVGMPLDDGKTEGAELGGDHIIEMNDSPAPGGDASLSVENEDGPLQ